MEMECDAMSDDSGITVGRNSLLNASELSLDVKMAFVTVVKLINELKPGEESYECLTRIITSTKKYVEQKRAELRNEAANTSLALLHHPPALPPNREPLKTYSSIRPLNESLRTDIRSLDRSSRIVHPDYTHNSSFRPIPYRNGRVALNGNGYGYGKMKELDITSIAESVIAEEEEECNSNSTLAESLGEDMIFILKKWSIKKEENNLYLTGTKLDRKGNLLEKDFISKKVLSRPSSEIVRTQCGDYKLDEPISDPKKCIPSEVKDIFLKDSNYFPKTWRKTLALWNEIEKKNPKQKRKSNPKPKDDVKAPGKAKVDTKSLEADKSTSKSKKTPTPEGNDTTINKKNASEKKPSPSENKNAQKSTEENVAPQKNKKEEPKILKKKNENNKPTKQQEKNKKEPKQALKKEKKADKSSTTKAANAKKTKLDELLGIDEAPFENELADLGGEDLFQMPSMSLTPNGLMASIRKESITGRWTPPTNVFDNIYGKITPASTASMLEDSFDIASKDNNVVKRMAKAKLAPTKKPLKPKPDHKVSQTSALPKIDEKNNQFLNQVIQAAVSSNPSKTPELVKKVFRSMEKDEDEEEEEDEDEDEL